MLKTYLFPIAIGLAVFVGSRYISKAPLPCANTITCHGQLREEIDNQATGTFLGHSITPPKIDLLATKPSHPLSPVLGDSIFTGDKHIYVDLSTQTLYAYQGESQVMKTLISSGRWGKTPTGNFHIQSKFRATRMAGGQGSDAYDLPNVPYTMFFYGDFGLHGAYWHNNFGHTMSHGCVNMRIVDAKTLFDWADGPTIDQLGTPVSVCDTFISPNICNQDKPVK